MRLQDACLELYDELPDVVFFSKDAQGRYTHGNRTLLARLGLRSLDQLVGRTAAELFPAPLGASYLQQDLRVIATGHSVHDELELHLFPNHRPGWCITVKHPLRSGATVEGLAGISRDLRHPSRQSPAYQRLARSIAHARVHCTDPLSVAALADHAGMSVAQLERHLVALFQLTPARWLLSLRLEAAMRGLRGTASVAQVAADCGFADHSAFARAFRRHVGLSPTDFRGVERRAPERAASARSPDVGRGG